MTECLDEEAMLSFGQGTMAPERRPSVEAHLAQCEECRALVSAVKRSSVVDTEERGALPVSVATMPLEPPAVSAPPAEAPPSAPPAAPTRTGSPVLFVIAIVAALVAAAIALGLR